MILSLFIISLRLLLLDSLVILLTLLKLFFILLDLAYFIPNFFEDILSIKLATLLIIGIDIILSKLNLALQYPQLLLPLSMNQFFKHFSHAIL